MKYAADSIKKKSLAKHGWSVEQRNNLVLIFSPLLIQYPKLVHAFTTRNGGNSQPPFHSFNLGINNTTDEEVQKDARLNRQILCSTLDLPGQDLITAKRLIHSTDIIMLETTEQPGEVDGIVISTKLRPVYMTFADCVPIIIYDSIQHVICLVHAGWRGTASGISRNAVRFMQDECGSKANNLVCAIGPAIGSCCYPVGLEVIEKLIFSLVEDRMLKEVRDKLGNLSLSNAVKEQSALGRCSPEATDKMWSLIEDLDLEGFFIREKEQIQVDLKAINAYQIMNEQVGQMDVTDFCTSCKEDLFYSFRRAYVKREGPTGRQAAIACLL